MSVTDLFGEERLFVKDLLTIPRLVVPYVIWSWILHASFDRAPHSNRKSVKRWLLSPSFTREAQEQQVQQVKPVSLFLPVKTKSDQFSVFVLKIFICSTQLEDPIDALWPDKNPEKWKSSTSSPSIATARVPSGKVPSNRSTQAAQ